MRKLYKSCKRKLWWLREKNILRDTFFKRVNLTNILPNVIDGKQLLELQEPVVTVVLVEHLGDIIACEPVIRYIKQEYPNHKIAWVCKVQYCEIFFAHPDLDYIVPVYTLYRAAEIASQAKKLNHHIVINLHFSSRRCTVSRKTVYNDNNDFITMDNYYYFGSLLESFSMCAGIGKLSTAPHFYLDNRISPPSLPEKYCVIHAVSNEQSRDWDINKWHDLLKYLYSNGLYAVEVGLSPVLQSDSPYYIDMTNNHSIQSTAKIVSGAHFFFGIDSSIAHLANALQTNGLVIMGRYRDFIEHVPYTGLYSSEHIVRCLSASAYHVPAIDVISFYNKIK